MGFSISKHYCGSQLVEVSINSVTDPCCDNLGASACCHNETEHFQLDVDFLSPVLAGNIQVVDWCVLFSLVSIYIIDAPGIENKILNYAESPQLPTIQTRLSLLQTYRC